MNKRKSRLWVIDKEFLQTLVKDSKSIAEICRRLGISSSGDQHKQIKKILNERAIDYSHIKIGLGSNLGRTFNKASISLEDVLVENSNYNRGSLKKRLIKAGLLENKCRNCGLKDSWQGEPITLQLEHKNGNGKDNRIENLEILCPNCHSQTATWGAKRFKIHRKCVDCSRPVVKGSSRCCACSGIIQRKQERPSREILLKELEKSNYVAVGRNYGVSDNTIRNWLK